MGGDLFDDDRGGSGLVEVPGNGSPRRGKGLLSQDTV